MCNWPQFAAIIASGFSRLVSQEKQGKEIKWDYSVTKTPPKFAAGSVE